MGIATYLEESNPNANIYENPKLRAQAEREHIRKYSFLG
jgi:hypothetical protein